MPYDRINILALDSVCWEVLLPLVEDGTMPALGSFLRKASYGVLESTIPPHTAAAWTTFLTGKDPGRHGVIDFVRYDPVQHRYEFHDSGVVRHDSFLTRLSDAGIPCGSIFLPRNYPPYPLKGGYIVSGFETPNTQCAFTHPPELRQEVLQVSPKLHFNFEDDWEDDRENFSAFARNIERAIAAVDLLERLAIHCQRQHPARLQVCYLQATDILFHKAWKWCVPLVGGDEDPRRREMIKKFFKRVDLLINRALGLHSSSSRQQPNGGGARTLRLICSDHGHGSSNGRIYVNNLLQEWGYLTPLTGLPRFKQRLRMLALNAAKRRALNKQMDVDWAHTRAYMAHVGIYGFLYINLKGREPHGTVPVRDFEFVRDEIIERFSRMKIPGSEKPLFPRVLKGETVYARKAELHLPDLVLVPADGFFPRKKFTKDAAIRVTPKSIGGVHRTGGVYAFEGDGVVPSNGLGQSAGIADIAPTILAAMGQPLPRSMTGKPLLQLFNPPPPVHFIEDAAAGPGSAAPEAIYSSTEEKAIHKRLSDLGYLE